MYYEVYLALRGIKNVIEEQTFVKLATNLIKQSAAMFGMMAVGFLLPAIFLLINGFGNESTRYP